jgi:hypothetical protein
VRKARAKHTPRACEFPSCPRIPELARIAARSGSSDDWKALVEANASLLEAHDGEPGKLVARLRDNAVTLTLEEREFLANSASGKLVRPPHRPFRPSTKLKRELATKILTTALADKDQWKPNYTIENLIAETQRQSGLNKTEVWEIYKSMKAKLRGAIQQT